MVARVHRRREAAEEAPAAAHGPRAGVEEGAAEDEEHGDVHGKLFSTARRRVAGAAADVWAAAPPAMDSEAGGAAGRAPTAARSTVAGLSLPSEAGSAGVLFARVMQCSLLFS